MASRLQDRAGPHGLTTGQARLLVAAYDFLVAHGRVPTLEELGVKLGLGRSRVHQIIAQLADLGWVKQPAQQARGLQLLGVRLVPVFEEGPAGSRLRSLLNRDIVHYAPVQESASESTTAS